MYSYVQLYKKKNKNFIKQVISMLNLTGSNIYLKMYNLLVKHFIIIV